MKKVRQTGKRGAERGAALIIAIFVLLLISVIGIAMVVSSGTDNALANNYRTSTAAYYAGLAGLEEARGRILWKNPDFVNHAYAGYFPVASNPAMGLGQVLYIRNPAAGETVDPTDLSNPASYPDNEYLNEFGVPVTGATVRLINSKSGAGGVPGPSFKWVRVTAATERSLGIDVDSDGAQDAVSVLYYDPMHVGLDGSVKPGLVRVPTATSRQALQVTALAVIPPNTQKLLQYVVVPNWFSMNFFAGLTLAGNNVNFEGPNSGGYLVNGNDLTVGRTCAAPAQPPVLAIGYTNAGDGSSAHITAGTAVNPGNYIGAPPPPPPPPALPLPPTPSIGSVTLAPNLQTPSQLEGLVQTIKQAADAQYDNGSWPRGSDIGTALNPSTVVVNGDLDLTAWHHAGYGLLLVTGNLTYDPDASWEGIVLVIGKGTITGAHAGAGRIDGAVFVAQTRDLLGNVLPDPNLGSASVTFDPTMGGLGIYYNSCWIAAAQQPANFRILSFREITSPN